MEAATETAREPLALGVIGAGVMGRRMLDAIRGQDASPVRVAAVWDPVAAALDHVGSTHPEVPRAAEAAAVVAASACVYVASPPASHIGHARMALAAGEASSARSRSRWTSPRPAPSWRRPGRPAR